MTAPAPNLNTLWARTLVDELGRHGLEHVCVGSGSRSAPLVEAFDRDPRFRLHAHVDERSAAFFALGIGAATGTAAAVVTTSGTAAANLFPAVIEASRGEIPLLAITADRPAELRGLDANQTIDQERLFGGYPRLALDLPLPRASGAALRLLALTAARVWTAVRETPRGPAHLNVQFEKPLEPTVVPDDLPMDPGGGTGPRPGAGTTADGAGTAPFVATTLGGPGGADAVDAVAHAVAGARRPLIVCGPTHDPEAGPAALALAARLRAPVLADPLSGARFHPLAPAAAIGWTDALLGSPGVRQRLAPDLVIRIGPAPTSTVVNGYLAEHRGALQLVIDAGRRWKDHLATAAHYVRADAGAVLNAVTERIDPRVDGDWPDAWRELEGVAGEALAPRLAGQWFEGAAASAVAAAVPEGGTLFVGNSMPVRDLDAFVPPMGRALGAIGFRGASGIDGNVSGAIGAATARGRPSAAIVGDLTLLHDVGALFAGRRLDVPLQIVVIQNRGGGIFHMLPISGFDPPFTPYIVMPHDVDFAAVAAAAGIPHRLTESGQELEAALGSGWSKDGIRLIEARFDRELNWELRTAALAAATEAVSGRL